MSIVELESGGIFVVTRMTVFIDNLAAGSPSAAGLLSLHLLSGCSSNGQVSDLLKYASGFQIRNGENKRSYSDAGRTGISREDRITGGRKPSLNPAD
tara:strand:+ start:5143 stop:5433 length:291 start_codon:yes stop_codon:yes gene_type:complete